MDRARQGSRAIPTKNRRETSGDDRDDVEESESFLNLVAFIPGRNNVDKRREESSLQVQFCQSHNRLTKTNGRLMKSYLKDTQKNSANAQLAPSLDETHT